MLTPEQTSALRQREGLPPTPPPASNPAQESAVSQRLARFNSAVAPTPEPTSPAVQVGSKIVGGAKKVADILTKSEQGFGESIAGAIIPHTQAGQQFDEAQKQSLDANNDYITLISQRLKDKRSRGEDTTDDMERLRKAGAFKGPDSSEFNPAIDKTTKQVLGEALGVATDIASFGTYGNAAKGAQGGKLLVKGAASKLAGSVLPSTVAEKVIPTAISKVGAFTQGAIKGATESGLLGTAFGAAQAMQDNKENGEVAKQALISGGTSALIGGILNGLSNIKNRDPKVVRDEAIASYKKGLGATKEKYKEMTDKVIPDLLDDKVWGSHKALLKKAEKGIQLSSAEYEKLGELQGMIDIAGLNTQIDDQIMSLSRGGRAFAEKAEKITNTIDRHVASSGQVLSSLPKEEIDKLGGMSELLSRTKTNIVMQLREQGITDLGDLVDNMDLSKFDDLDEYARELKRISTPYITPQPISVNTSKVSKLKQLKEDIGSLGLAGKPKEAYQQDLRELAQEYGTLIYDSRKSIKTVDDSQTLSQVRKVDLAIRDLLNSKNPEYSKINKVYTLNSRLFDILDETARRKEGHRVVSWLNGLMGTGGAATGAAIGTATGIPILGPLLGGTIAISLTSILNSTWYNTLRAVQKAQLAEKLTKVGTLEGAKYWTKLLSTQGVKAANELLATPEEKLDQPKANQQ